MSTHPKGKVVHDHHHRKDRRKMDIIHYAALISATAVAIALLYL